MKSRTHLKRKEVDDVLGGDDSWGNQAAGMSQNKLSALQFPVCDFDFDRD
jgi:hypothetical protein